MKCQLGGRHHAVYLPKVSRVLHWTTLCDRPFYSIGQVGTFWSGRFSGGSQAPIERRFICSLRLDMGRKKYPLCYLIVMIVMMVLFVLLAYSYGWAKLYSEAPPKSSSLPQPCTVSYNLCLGVKRHGTNAKTCEYAIPLLFSRRCTSVFVIAESIFRG